MKINRRWMTGGLTAVALAAVVTGTSMAQSNTPTAPADQTATADDEANEGPEGNEADEADENEPALNGSITAPEDESLSEDEEAAQLATTPGLISDADAIAAATADGGTADTATLENENGSVVYEVDVTNDDGTVSEVKVDAGNGDVLATETDDEADEVDEDDEGPEDETDDGDEAEDEANEGPEDEANEGPEDEANEGPEGQETSETGASTTP